MNRKKRKKRSDSFVYLLHFSKPLGNPDNPHGLARHYIGTAYRVDRITDHQKGKGAKLTQAAVKQGIRVQLARVWEGASYSDERRLKARKSAPRFCPICNPTKAWNYANLVQAGSPRRTRNRKARDRAAA